MKRNSVVRVCLVVGLGFLPMVLTGAPRPGNEAEFSALLKQAANKIGGSVGDRQASLASLRKIIDSPNAAPELKMQATLLRATTYQTKAREYTKAIGSYSTALRYTKDPKEIAGIREKMADCYVLLRDQQNAIRILESLLLKSDAPLTPHSKRSVLTKLAMAYDSNAEQTEALRCLETLLAEKLILTAAEGYELTWRIALLHFKMGDIQKGVAKAEQGLADYPLVPASRKIIAVLAIAQEYLKNGQAEEAVAVLKSAIAKYSDADLKSRLSLHYRLADTYHKSLQDLEKACAAYEGIIAIGRKQGADKITIGVVKDAYVKLAGLYDEMGQSDKAFSTLRACLKECGSSCLVVAEVAKKLLGLEIGEQQSMEACWVLRENMANHISDIEAVDSCQQAIVELLLRSGRNEEALQEARILFYACSEKNIQPAIDLVAAAFKAVDFNLARANMFLRYLRVGPAGEDKKLGTQDDLVDMLMDVPALADQRRAQIFKSKFDDLSQDWLGHQQRSLIYVYLDQPAEAFDELAKSFVLCPTKEKELQQATDALTGFVIRYTKDNKLAESLAQYIMFGSAGKDGRPGTKDDLQKPISQVMQKLQQVRKKQVASRHPSKSVVGI